MAAEKIRESILAGTWYPDRPEVLRSDIERYLDQAKPGPLKGELIGLVAPHAGYAYSGGVAAHAYKLLLDSPFDRVLIVAPSHRAYFRGVSIYKLGGYRTPLGLVPLDHEIIDALLQAQIPIDYIPEAHSQEHSLEIQLPFLQVVLSDFRLTPVIMGDQSFENCKSLAAAIARHCRGKRVLLVASSDLSHFHPYQEARRLDDVVVDRVGAFDIEGLSQDLRTGNCEACGGGPMMTIMLAASQLGANKARVLRYANSGDVTGETRGVVGYMSAAFYNNPGSRKDRPGHPNERVGIDLGLTTDEKALLRDVAFRAIRSRCFGEPVEEFHTVSSRLNEPRGAFVCLKKAGNLRGCIGMIEAKTPLIETIRSMAIQAAFADPRFCALEPSELDELEIELSVLTPLERIKDPSQIQIGKHGLFIRQGYHSGLLLPQVATENGWDRDQFLEWTCKKAGLSPKAWKEEDAEVYIFSADIF